VCAVKGRNPGAYLTDCLRKKRFNLIRQVDEEAARQAVKMLLHPDPCPRTAALQLDEEAELIAAANARKREMRARLAAVR
jgi:hypothetical protein